MSIDLNKIEELGEEAIAAVLNPLSEAGVDFLKMLISYWDRLVVLNAGIFALSFTAAIALREHAVGDGGIGYLFSAWKLLISSIACALLAQIAASLSAGHLKIVIHGSEAIRIIRKMRAKANIEQSPLQVEPKVKQSDRYEAITRHSSHFFGMLAQITNFIALLRLYTFVHINLAKFPLALLRH